MGGVGETLFGDGGAGAAGAAAMDKEREARRQYALAEQRYGEIKDITGRATSGGIAQFEKDIANQEKNLARQEQMISQLDPTIIEASQQALRLLRGETSSTLAPLKRQRDMQRQKLVNSLREQMGPGAETSSAGMQALTMFDSETDNLFAGAQQQALSNLGSISAQFTAQRPDMFREIAGRSNFGQGASNLLFQQAGALNQAGGQLGQFGQSLVDTAGAGHVERMMKGQADSAFRKQLFGAAVMGGAMAAGAPPAQSKQTGDVAAGNESKSSSGGSTAYDFAGFFK